MLTFKLGPRASGTRGLRITLLTGTLACLAMTASATELGQSHVDFGLLDTLVGVPPPPGFYLGENVAVQTSSRLNNRNGDPVTINMPGCCGSFEKLIKRRFHICFVVS